MAKSDVNFVHALHAQANARVSRKVDALFIIIVSFFVGVILWASLSEIDELARGEGKVIPSEKIQTLQNLDGGVVSHILVKGFSQLAKEMHIKIKEIIQNLMILHRKEYLIQEGRMHNKEADDVEDSEDDEEN